MNYQLTSLIFGNKIYNLRFPLRCKFENEEGFYTIQSELLDIIGTGETEDEAENTFGQEFDFIFKRYNGLEEGQL